MSAICRDRSASRVTFLGRRGKADRLPENARLPFKGRGTSYMYHFYYQITLPLVEVLFDSLKLPLPLAIQKWPQIKPIIVWTA